ncbi:MAG: DUF429 domain-containing protein [Ktedonobacteraceae bacterium]
MHIFGLDFTSAPTHKKPITCAVGELQGSHLHIHGFLNIPSLAAFEAFLRTPGPWLAACDFPFGQPKKLLINLGWPMRWEEYIAMIAALDKREFEFLLYDYRNGRTTGDKHHLRATDKYAGACSPMMLQRVPVGKMFYQGAPRLLAAGVSILPCHPTNDDRIVVEGYPALVARKWVGRSSYKSDERGKQTAEKEEARQHIVRGICSHDLYEQYGLNLELASEMMGMLIHEGTADSLDAMLCAVQAAWAYTKRDEGYGIPAECDVDEGWIVDAIPNVVY